MIEYKRHRLWELVRADASGRGREVSRIGLKTRRRLKDLGTMVRAERCVLAALLITEQPKCEVESNDGQILKQNEWFFAVVVVLAPELISCVKDSIRPWVILFHSMIMKLVTRLLFLLLFEVESE